MIAPVANLGEIFKHHPVWTYLAVSDMGRVFNTRTGNYLGFLIGPRGGRPQHRNDYLKVTVKTEGGKQNFRSHVLVLETFVGPRPADSHGDHINHNSLDNRLSNLRWRGASENCADTHRPSSRRKS